MVSVLERAPLLCPKCGGLMREVFDERAKAFTGFNWRCDCSPSVVLMICGDGVGCKTNI